MMYDRVRKMAEGMGDHLHGHRIVGLMVPDESSYAPPWQEIESPGSRNPFDKVYRAGSVLLPFLRTGSDLERAIDAVRVLRLLRAEGLILAAGCSSVTGDIEAGSCVIIDDHVNCTGENPLRGPNDERLGPRYPDMSGAYDPRMSRRLERAAEAMDLTMRRAVYGRIGRDGRGNDFTAWSQSGIDVAGEGLVDEVIAAAHCGLPAAAVGFVEKVWPEGQNPVFSSVPVRSANYGRLTVLINQCYQ